MIGSRATRQALSEPRALRQRAEEQLRELEAKPK
jgi:hypothetical protein